MVTRTDLGRAIRAVAKEKQGARLVGIDVEHVYAMSFGIGLACLGAAACFLLPAYYVNPQVGSGFVLVAFTIVVLGGMGSFAGALVGGLLIGVVESLGGLLLGESLGQIGIFVIFIAVLLFRPQGLFGGAGHEARPRRDRAVRRSRSARRRSSLDSGVVLNFMMMALYADAAGAGLEPAGRLRRPVLVRPCAVLRHRRLRAGDRAAAARLNAWRRCRWRSARPRWSALSSAR